MGYWSNALWDLWDGSITGSHEPILLPRSLMHCDANSWKVWFLPVVWFYTGSIITSAIVLLIGLVTTDKQVLFHVICRYSADTNFCDFCCVFFHRFGGIPVCVTLFMVQFVGLIPRVLIDVYICIMWAGGLFVWPAKFDSLSLLIRMFQFNPCRAEFIFKHIKIYLHFL